MHKGKDENAMSMPDVERLKKQGSFAKSRKPKYRFGYRVQDTTTEKEVKSVDEKIDPFMVSYSCLLYTSPSPRD